MFSSKGRLTDYGYEIEIRIPLKSLKYQSGDEQSWDLNIVREVQHSGSEDSWVPAKRANASFLAQSGTLDGLTGLTRGLVLDVNLANVSTVATVVYLSGESWWTTVTVPSPPLGM